MTQTTGQALKKLSRVDADTITELADSISQTELDYLDGVTAGTVSAGKALVADSNSNAGAVKATSLSLGATGSELLQANIVKLSETVAYSAFTDGGGTSGTYDITAGTIPIGATFLYSAVTAVTGFAGDTSAVLIIGDGTDTDRYNTGTIDVFSTAANGISAGAPSGTRYHAAAATVTLTVTSGADFTSVSAGSVTVELYYLT